MSNKLFNWAVACGVTSLVLSPLGTLLNPSLITALLMLGFIGPLALLGVTLAILAIATKE